MSKSAYEVLLATKFSRVDEGEADRIGLKLAARARRDSHAGFTLWLKTLKASSSNCPPEFVSMHPAEANRIQQIEALPPIVLLLYQAARRGS